MEGIVADGNEKEGMGERKHDKEVGGKMKGKANEKKKKRKAAERKN